jgi:hypothetical protein
MNHDFTAIARRITKYQAHPTSHTTDTIPRWSAAFNPPRIVPPGTAVSAAGMAP